MNSIEAAYKQMLIESNFPPAVTKASKDLYIAFMKYKKAIKPFTTSDVINKAILGVEIGTDWEAPPLAKYITSADNRLILLKTPFGWEGESDNDMKCRTAAPQEEPLL